MSRQKSVSLFVALLLAGSVASADRPSYWSDNERPAKLVAAELDDDGRPLPDRLREDVRRLSVADAALEEGEVEFVDLLQPGATRPPGVTPRRPAPPPPPPAPPPTFAYSRLSSMPNMFGDFGGGPPLLLQVQPQPTMLTQIVSGLFVTNGAGTEGANTNPAVPVFVRTGSANGPIIAQSVGNGLDVSGDGQPDTYPISEPAGFSPQPGAVYSGGAVVFVNLPPVNQSTQAQNGSVGVAPNWNMILGYTPPPAAFPPIRVGGGGAIRRNKIAENASPEPRDRVLFNYNFFNDLLGLGDVNRTLFGFEKTFFDRLGSVEVRLPLAGTIASSQIIGQQAHDLEFGNLQVIFKAVMWRADDWLVSAGAGVALPTAKDIRYFRPAGIDFQQIVQIENDAVRLLPFVGYMTRLGEQGFLNSYVQLEIDTTGSPTRADITGANLQPIGVLQDPTLLFLDLQIGYHLYHDPSNDGVTDISPYFEAHYTTSVQDADFVAGNGVLLTGLTNRFDTVNLTAGMNVAIRDTISIRPAFVLPVSTGDNRIFDYEAGLQVNVRY